MKTKKNRTPEARRETSPANSLITDLVTLKRTSRSLTRAYLGRLEAEIDAVAAWASDQAKSDDLPKSRIRDLGDMITLVRKLEKNSDSKGRRRDLKRIDTTLQDLREISGLQDR